MPGLLPSERAGTRRTILVNQTLLAAGALLGTVAAVLLGQVQHASTFVLGSGIVFAGAAAAILLPWSRFPVWVSGLIPIADVVAVGLLRESAPTAGLGLLWAFPAMWIGSVYGIVGVITVSVSVLGVIALQLAVTPGAVLSASSLLMPFIVAALSAIAHLSERRAQAQRVLLQKQSAELRRSLTRARRQEDLVTQVLDAVDFGVIRIDAHGESAVANEAHARLLGAPCPDGEAGEVYAADGLTPLGSTENPLTRARAGMTFDGELMWFGAPGTDRRALSITAKRLPDGGAGNPGSVVVSRDVTVEQLALRARDDLVASVSHELRTPMTSIMGYLELALDDPGLPPETRSQLEVAARNAARLRELVADILAVSAASAHGVDFALAPVPTDVAVIVRAAIEAVAPRAAEQAIAVEASGVRSAVAPVDPHRLRQVVDNLLSNAVKYNARGGTVFVSVERGASAVTVTVRDDGAGIPAAEQARLFERFFRSDAVRNSATHGSGLGLAISRDIVRAHGGDISVRSHPGEGATFVVRLPAPREETP
ncbi:sensor histidine kinase [Microbacterium enclense]|uniref:sensor histidine kinase n=1 Tax=Microbacterium enclense TaxID=993073 RepID=UPI0036DB6E24